MKVRVVIEEVIVDAECQDTLTPGVGAEALLQACTIKALELHKARKEDAKK